MILVILPSIESMILSIVSTGQFSIVSLTRSENNRSNHSKSLINMLTPLTLVKLYTRVQKWFQLPPLSYLPPPPPPHTNFHEKFKKIHEDIHIAGRNQSTICQNLTTPVNRCFYFRTNSDSLDLKSETSYP